MWWSIQKPFSPCGMLMTYLLHGGVRSLNGVAHYGFDSFWKHICWHIQGVEGMCQQVNPRALMPFKVCDWQVWKKCIFPEKIVTFPTISYVFLYWKIQNFPLNGHISLEGSSWFPHFFPPWWLVNYRTCAFREPIRIELSKVGGQSSSWLQPVLKCLWLVH